MGFLFTTCCVTATVHLSIRNIVSNKNERYCVSRHSFNANPIHDCMQLKSKDFLTKSRSLLIEIKMCRTCISNVSCGRGEMVVAPMVG